MQIVQRVLLIAAVTFSVMLCCFCVSTNNIDKNVEQWEEMKVEQFMQRLNRNRSFSINEYKLLLKEVKYLDDTAKVILEIYEKEWDMKEQEYYYLVLQDEIQKKLENGNGMELEEGSIVKIMIQHNCKRNLYYAVIPGPDGRY